MGVLKSYDRHRPRHGRFAVRLIQAPDLELVQIQALYYISAAPIGRRFVLVFGLFAFDRSERVFIDTNVLVFQLCAAKDWCPPH